MSAVRFRCNPKESRSSDSLGHSPERGAPGARNPRLFWLRFGVSFPTTGWLVCILKLTVDEYPLNLITIFIHRIISTMVNITIFQVNIPLWMNISICYSVGCQPDLHWLPSPMWWLSPFWIIWCHFGKWNWHFCRVKPWMCSWLMLKQPFCWLISHSWLG